ncbi:MAG: hypothetical protein J6F33_08990 [Acidaminococcaceae bacterium]|nr:hypothetical protein [Acidaminococcaceae bacterium]
MTFQDLDLKTKKLLLLLLSVLLCWWLFSASATASASGMSADQTQAVYQITELELTTLENNISTLKSINEKLQMELAAQKRELHVLREESSTLLNQLNSLRQRSEMQDDLLMKANKSLEKYATEAKRERLRIKAQRNFWECFAAAAVIVAVTK